MGFRIALFAVVVVVSGISVHGFAQIPFEPAQAQPAQAASAPVQTGQPDADVKWLTSYFLVNEGYRFDHLPALERSFEKMSPTQLRTLRQFIEEKHAMNMQRAATLHQLQSQQLVDSAAYERRKQQSLNRYHGDLSQVPSIGDVRLEHMKNLAEANERGDLIQFRTPQTPGTDPFGPTPGRPFGFGSYGDR